jgi:cbb3-type cytochrome oxidase cytochrome c subunit
VAEETPKDASATFYGMKAMNRWFLVSVALLTGAYLLSVWKDHAREWKVNQRDFMELERELAIEQGSVAYQADGGDATANKLNSDIERMRRNLDAATERRKELEKEVRAAELAFNKANAAMKAAKATYESDRFHYEEEAYAAERRAQESAPDGKGAHAYEDAFDAAKIHDEELRERFEKFEKLKDAYLGKDEEAKKAEAELAKAKADLAAFNALAANVEVDLDKQQREFNRFAKRADSVDMDRLFNKFRNGILVNFMAPTVQPKKIVVNEIFDDLNFLKIPKVDMCVTCHLATDRNKDYPPGNSHVMDDTADPWLLPEFHSHSKPELFCTSLSPHGQERFGCSGCHGGANQRLEFATTFHTPTDEKERQVWEETHGWHPVHEWDFPMLSSEFVDASCYKCHKSEVHIAGAAKWNHGRDLAAKLGCFGCHKMAPLEGARRVGPPLGHLVTKLADLDWTLKWVDKPSNFRPTTRMPAFFHLENRAQEPGRAEAEVTALVTYILSLNTPQELDKYPGNGDAERGRAIVGGDFGGKGCLACHNVDEFKNATVGDLRHGPDLSGVGSKLSPDWLYTWIRDPKRLWPDTNMPNLRLTDAEAADVVAFLLTKKNALFESGTFAKPDGDAPYEQILREKLTERTTTDEADAAIRDMSSFEKRRKSGEFLLNHYGCFGCHDIPGFEDAKPIGTELNGWGSKHADRLDFGEYEMDWKAKGWFNRETWVKQKLSNTRFYDRGKDKKPFEKLKMPQFALLAGPDVEAGGADPNAADREAVMTYVMSLVKDNTAASIQRTLTPAQQAVERGRRLVREKNCIGCHIINGEGGEIRHFEGDTEEGAAYYPPILDGQGARTQPDWLFRFLGDPVQGAGRGAKALLRPWMKARMPTFGFTQQQLNDLVAFFAHEEVFQTAEDQALWDATAAKFAADFPGYDKKSVAAGDRDKRQLYSALVARQYKRAGGKFLYETDFPYITKPAPLAGRDLERGRHLFADIGKCIECHLPGGKIMVGKTEADLAPDLTHVRQRLNPKWVVHWFEGPGNYQPKTRMPNFWPLEKGVRGSIDDSIGDANREMQLLRDYLFSDEFKADYEKIASTVKTK